MLEITFFWRYDKHAMGREEGSRQVQSCNIQQIPQPGGGGGGVTPIYGLYRYVPRDRVWFLRSSVLIFAPFGIVFPVLSLDRVPKSYQLK